MGFTGDDSTPRLARGLVFAVAAALLSVHFAKAVARIPADPAAGLTIVAACLAILALEFRPLTWPRAVAQLACGFVAVVPAGASIGLLAVPAGAVFLQGLWVLVPPLLAGAAWVQAVRTDSVRDTVDMCITVVLGGIVLYAVTTLAALAARVHGTRLTLAAAAVTTERLRIASGLDADLSSGLVRIRDLAAQEDPDLLDVLLADARTTLAATRATAADLRSLSLTPEAASARALLQSAGIEADVVTGHTEPLGPAGTVLATVLREAVTAVVRVGDARHCQIVTGEAAGQVTLLSSVSAGAVPAPVVHTGDARGPAEFPDSADASVRLISMGAVLGGTAVIVAVMVVVGTFVLSIQQRQREIAVLRAVAATGKQVRKMIGGEALAVGLVAGVAGAFAGLPLGAWLHDEFVSLGIIPANIPVVLSVFPMLASLLATVVAGWAAARISARRATRIRPVEALGEAELKPPRMSVVRVLFGALAAAGATVLTLLLTVLHSIAASQPVCLNAVLLWCIALALLGPWVARAAAAVLGVPLRGSRVGGYLAANNLRAAAPRLASVITPLTLMTAMACAILFSQTSIADAATAQRAAGNVADDVVGSKVPADAAADVRAVAGVRTVTQVLHATVRTGLDDRSVLGATPEGLADTLDLGVTAGSLAQFSGPSTAAAASGQGYHVGSQVSMTLPDGTPTRVTIVALYSRQLGFGDLVLAHDLLASHVDAPLDDELLVKAPGVPQAALTAALKADPGLGIRDRVAAQSSNGNDASTRFGYITLGLIVAFTAIAVVNTLAMSISDRGREFAALRLTGATRRQIQRMLGWETAVAVVVATGLALAVSVVVLTTYTSGMTRGTAGVSMPAGMLAAVLGGGVVLAGLATWVPARAALAAAARQE